MRLGAEDFTRGNALSVSLRSLGIPGTFDGLVDSGSMDCFVDSTFSATHGLVARDISPRPLTLIDGSVNHFVKNVVSLPIQLPCSYSCQIECYVTNLEGTYPLVLGHNWLTQHNPVINWKEGTLSLPSIGPRLPVPTTQPTYPDTALYKDSQPATPHISFVNAVVYQRACKEEGAIAYQLAPDLIGPKAQAVSVNSNPIELKNLPEEYHNFADVFSKLKSKLLPEHRPYDLSIQIEGKQTPPLGPIYSLSALELQTLREFLDENLKTGTIRPSNSPCGAPVLFVKKKDGSLRLCVDYRGLNKLTRKDRYPIPLLSDLLDAPNKARIYSKIDLKSAYHLVRIASGDEWKTTFRTRYGSFEWLVIPFGLSNAPSAFQRFMNETFADLLDVCVVIYLDDILIYSNNLKEHRIHVKEVLRRLRENKLYASPSKCLFHQDKIEFLGFVISKDGLQMDNNKVQTIHDWPAPRRVKDIQSFLGFANFYRRFIQNYSALALPLTHLTRKSTPWNWTMECEVAFKTIKEAFTMAPLLRHWEPDSPLVLETDASDLALAAILSICTNDDLHPIAFHSRTLQATGLNYDVHDKELLAIVEAFKKWRHYLEGTAIPVDVITDHKNLTYFCSSKTLTRRQARWSEFLSQFNLIIKFRPGRLGRKPDALTRRWDVYDKAETSSRTTQQPLFSQRQLADPPTKTSTPSPRLQAAVVTDLTQLLSDVREALGADPKYMELIARDTNYQDLQWEIREDGLLYFERRVYVPDASDLRLQVLQLKHDHILAGHPGQSKTYQLTCQDFYWPNLREFVADYVSSCNTCARNKSRRHKPYGMLKQLPIPPQPWESISMDFIEQLPLSNGYTDILVVVDRLTKQAIFIPTTRSIDATGLAQLFIENVFSKHGTPSHVTSDRGVEFVSKFFKSLANRLDMKLHFTSGYYPEADGQTERTNQTLEQFLRIYCNYQQSD